MEVALEIAGLEAGGQRLDEIALALDGRLSEHRLTLDASAPSDMPLSRAALVLEGGLDQARTRYAGQLSSLEVDAEQGELRLDGPALFTVDLEQGSARVEPFCLSRRQGGNLCLVEPMAASAEGGEVSLRVEEVPMALLDPFLPEAWSAEGVTELDLDAGWGAGGSWRADGRLQSRLALDGQDAYGQPWSLPEARLGGRISADDQTAEIALELGLDQAGSLALEARIDDPAGEGRLTGNLSLDGLRLAPYRSLVTGMETLEGNLAGDIDLAGRLEAPEMRGRIALSGLKASGADVPVEVRDGEIGIDLAGTAASIRAISPPRRAAWRSMATPPGPRRTTGAPTSPCAAATSRCWRYCPSSGDCASPPTCRFVHDRPCCRCVATSRSPGRGWRSASCPPRRSHPAPTR